MIQSSIDGDTETVAAPSGEIEAVKPFLVGDRWRLGAGHAFRSIDPRNGRVSALIAQAEKTDVAEAVAAARSAVDGDWGRTPPHLRARLLHRIADLVRRDGESLARLQTADNGKTIVESRAQAGWAADLFDYYASVCEAYESSVIPSRGHYFSFNLHEPVGVVAAITPWNSPISLEAQKLAPALAAGNAVVLKSSEVTPQVGLHYAALALEAGLPAGTLNVITGLGSSVGAALVADPGVDMVTFTGGAEAGRAIGRAAGERLIPAMLELGGKSPNVVFDDADLGAALAGAVYGIYSNAGQSCIAGSRIFVQRSIYDRFVAELRERARGLVVGDPFDPATAVAPLASFGHRDRVAGLVDAARDAGASVLAGGRRPTGGFYDGGAYYLPTLIEVDNQAAIAQAEIFGPVACVIAFEDEEDLVVQANDTVFGLAAAIWTEDYRRALRVAKRIRAGTIWINTFKVTAVNMPFGGFKQSGFGRECGFDALRFYLADKAVYMDLAGGPVQWPPSP